MNDTNSYLKQIEDVILRSDRNILEIKDLTIVKMLNFTQNNITKIKDILETKRIDLLEGIPNDTGKKTFEDLTILSFLDHADNKYFVTIYDSDELWQDPQVIELYPI